MDERQKNFIFAVNAAGIAFVGIVALYFFFIAPIQNYETQKFLEQCAIEGYTCTVDYNWVIPVGLAIIPFMVFAAAYYHLENKRIKNWRSWN